MVVLYFSFNENIWGRHFMMILFPSLVSISVFLICNRAVNLLQLENYILVFILDCSIFFQKNKYLFMIYY
jgi:hypothetical protein